MFKSCPKSPSAHLCTKCTIYRRKANRAGFPDQYRTFVADEKQRSALLETTGAEESENSGIQQIAISVYRLRNFVEVQLYAHTVIPVYTVNCIIPYLILNQSGTTGKLNISVWGTHVVLPVRTLMNASPTFCLQKT